MVETLDQKVGAYVVDALLSNPSGIPSIRGATGRTGTLEHVVSCAQRGAYLSVIREYDLTQAR